MENVNKEKDVNTKIKEKRTTVFYRPSYTIRGCFPCPMVLHTAKLDTFFDGSSPGGLTNTLKVEAECSSREMGAESHKKITY
jgi:hypothetical protein